MISIDFILECMTSEKNYFGDMWKTCVNEDKKRYTSTKFKNILKKMQVLGHIKRYGQKGDTYYKKMYHHSIEENIGFINNLTFTYESKINRALKNLENKKIFLDISKDLNSYKLNKHSKTDYEALSEGMLGMFELASSILWTSEKSEDAKLKKELKICFTQINAFLEDVNQKLLKERKTTERVMLQRDFTGNIPKLGYLKL